MANFRRPEINMAAVRVGDSEAVMVAVADCAARWFSMAGSNIAVKHHASHVAREAGTANAGLLAAAMDLRELLAQCPNGRQALRDFGFEPVLQDVEGE